MAAEGKEDEVIDILKMGMQGDSTMGDLLGSAKNVGQALGNALTVLEYRGRIKHSGSDYGKLAATVGMVFGSMWDGVIEAKEYHSKKLMLPSEIRSQLKNQISELEAAKENPKLQKKLEELLIQVQEIPTKKLPENQEDLEASMKAKQKELEQDRKKLIKLQKQARKSSPS